MDILIYMLVGVVCLGLGAFAGTRLPSRRPVASDRTVDSFAGCFADGDWRMALLIEDREDHDGDLPLDPIRIELTPEGAGGGGAAVTERPTGSRG